MSQPTMREMWTNHYDTLNEERRIKFLLTLKIMASEGNQPASETFIALCLRFLQDPIAP
jgi:hypothetical protein